MAKRSSRAVPPPSSLKELNIKFLKEQKSITTSAILKKPGMVTCTTLGFVIWILTQLASFFYLLHKHGIAVYNIAGKVERAFRFFSEEEAQELLLQEGYDNLLENGFLPKNFLCHKENFWEEIHFPSVPLRIM